jgi:hypothetical protein
MLWPMWRWLEPVMVAGLAAIAIGTGDRLAVILLAGWAVLGSLERRLRPGFLRLLTERLVLRAKGASRN